MIELIIFGVISAIFGTYIARIWKRGAIDDNFGNLSYERE